MTTAGSNGRGSPIRGLGPGAVCGALVGFLGFGPASYFYHAAHEGAIIRGKEFFGYTWAARTPFEHARDHAVGFAVVCGSAGAVAGLVAGERTRHRPMGPAAPWVAAGAAFGLGLFHGVIMSSRRWDHLIEGPVLSSLSAGAAGLCGWAMLRWWLNSELSGREQTNDHGDNPDSAPRASSAAEPGGPPDRGGGE
ncbi:MAG TPA: hypothetical protein VKE40_23960 [Gemmataceae bacterium]|nr:hypothetical protein [Gemmataceae bacterium]